MSPDKLLNLITQGNTAPGYPAYEAIERAVIEFFEINPHSRCTTEQLACALTDAEDWAHVPTVLKAALTRPNVLAYHPALANCFELAPARQIGRNAHAQPKIWRKSKVQS